MGLFLWVEVFQVMRPLVVGYKQFGRNCHPHIPTEVGQLGEHLCFVCVCVCVCTEIAQFFLLDVISKCGHGPHNMSWQTVGLTLLV